MGKGNSIVGVVQKANSFNTGYGKATRLEILSDEKLVNVLIQEKETIKKGQRIRGFYNPNSTPITFYKYDLLDEEGNIEYSNYLLRIFD